MQKQPLPGFSEHGRVCIDKESPGLRIMRHPGDHYENYLHVMETAVDFAEFALVLA